MIILAVRRSEPGVRPYPTPALTSQVVERHKILQRPKISILLDPDRQCVAELARETRGRGEYMILARLLTPSCSFTSLERCAPYV
jgi:hypothetical protein